MAHFAKLDDNNIVIDCVKVANEVIANGDGTESEEKGKTFLKELYKEPNSVWVQASYNRNIRKNFPGLGHIYDATRDAFIEPKPYPSWSLDENTCQWKAPVEYPADDIKRGITLEQGAKVYYWKEDIQNWDIWIP
jgi:hypothetical protein